MKDLSFPNKHSETHFSLGLKRIRILLFDTFSLCAAAQLGTELVVSVNTCGKQPEFQHCFGRNEADSIVVERTVVVCISTQVVCNASKKGDYEETFRARIRMRCNDVISVY